MANKNKHHLKKRGPFWYFRKGDHLQSLETTLLTEAIRIRDTLLENYRITGRYNIIKDETLTFGSIVKRWAKIHSTKIKYSTWKDYRSAMNAHILPYFGDMLIEDITYMKVENFILTLGCSPKRVNNILIPMRSVFKMVFKEGLVKENVMMKIDNLPVEHSEIIPFSHDEVIKILDAIDPFYRNYTAVRFYSGARSGELDGIKWSDYFETMPSGPKLHINKTLVCGKEGKTKTKKSKRYIDCLSPVVDALLAQKLLTGNNDHIFCTKNGELMSPDHFREVIWKKALKKAGLHYRPPIQTRHTFATMMITAGEDIGWVQKMLGHSTLQMIFNHYYAWISQKTRTDGSAFMNTVMKNVGNNMELPLPSEGSGESGKIIQLFENVVQ